MNKVNFSPKVKALDKKMQFILKSNLVYVPITIVSGLFLLLHINPNINLAILCPILSTALFLQIYTIFKFEKHIKKRANLIEYEKTEQKFTYLDKPEVELSLNNLFRK